jgi:hypothetical protein
MEVSPSLLRGTGSAIHDLAEELRTACRERHDGPGDPAWDTDTELRAQSSAWDGYLGGLADRLEETGERLARAADGYTAADSRAAHLLGRRNRRRQC